MARAPRPWHLFLAAERCSDLQELKGLLRKADLDLSWRETRMTPQAFDPSDHADLLLVADGTGSHFSALWERHATLHRLPMILVQAVGTPKRRFTSPAVCVLDRQHLSAWQLAQAIKAEIMACQATFPRSSSGPVKRRVAPQSAAMH
jgi:hypothetical protein